MSRMMTIAGLMVLLVSLALPAAAEDAHPCGARYWHEVSRTGVGYEVQDCSMWRGDVPVYEEPVSNVGSGNQMPAPVGYLWSAEGNWFLCQAETSRVYRAPGDNDYANDWWAYTMADNGEWGWVPEVFFSGGDNFEKDGNLAGCPDHLDPERYRIVP